MAVMVMLASGRSFARRRWVCSCRPELLHEGGVVEEKLMLEGGERALFSIAQHVRRFPLPVAPLRWSGGSAIGWTRLGIAAMGQAARLMQ